MGKSEPAPVYVGSDPRVEDLPFVRDFARMCDNGWRMGWHERNGGNASYRLTPDDVQSLKTCLDGTGRSCGFTGSLALTFADQNGEGDSCVDGNCSEGNCADGNRAGEGDFVELGISAPALGGEWLLITATGSFMQNVLREPAACLGVIELDARGGAYRVVWGFAGGGRPTSEVAAHVLIHERKKLATDGVSRVLYHCHPVPVIALTHVVGCDARAITRLLWKMMTECVMVFPEGLGVVPCEVPGSMELARLTADVVAYHHAVVWAQHGLLATGESLDAAFGLVHVVVKAAQIYESACAMAGGPAGVCAIPDDELVRLAQGLGVTLNPAYL